MSVREIVGVACLALLFAGLLLWPRTRTSGVVVLKALIAKPIVIVLGLLTLYLGVCIAGMHEIGLWQPRDWSLTLYWLVGSAFLTILSTKEIAESPLKVSALTRETLTIAVVLQFIAGAYSLAWWVELALVPIVAFLAMVAAIAERERRTRSVSILANVLLAAIGLIFLYNGAASAISNWSEFATIETVRVFFLPIALALAFIPARIGLAHYMTFERLYNGSRMRTSDASVRRYAMTRALMAFGFDHHRAERFYRGAGPDAFLNQASVDARIAELKRRMRLEARPPAVDPRDGWSPYVASRFLSDQGTVAEDYRPLLTLWQANSKPLTTGSDRFSALIEYHVEGDERIAGRLRLSGYVEPREDGPVFRGKFNALAKALATAAIDSAAGELLAARLESGGDFTFAISERSISFRIDNDAVAGGGARELELFVDCRGGYDPHTTMKTEAA